MVNQDSRDLELILQYKMDDMETKAYKISCLYLEKEKIFFPNYQHCRPPKGDPRKSLLFKYCHKLIREKGNKIADEDYGLYIHAQFDIMRNIKTGDLHPLISPACIAGEPAWKRWLLWKTKYEKHLESKASANVASAVNIHSTEKIQKDLWKTKQFLIAWFDRLNTEDILKSLNDRDIFLWYQTGSICGYYFVLSPIVNKWLKENAIDLKKEYDIDLNFYQEAKEPEIIKYFKKEFPDEGG